MFENLFETLFGSKVSVKYPNFDSQLGYFTKEMVDAQALLNKGYRPPDWPKIDLDKRTLFEEIALRNDFIFSYAPDELKYYFKVLAYETDYLPMLINLNLRIRGATTHSELEEVLSGGLIGDSIERFL
jgi:hypothetical protein